RPLAGEGLEGDAAVVEDEALAVGAGVDLDGVAGLSGVKGRLDARARRDDEGAEQAAVLQGLKAQRGPTVASVRPRTTDRDKGFPGGERGQPGKHEEALQQSPAALRVSRGRRRSWPACPCGP